MDKKRNSDYWSLGNRETLNALKGIKMVIKGPDPYSSPGAPCVFFRFSIKKCNFWYTWMFLVLMHCVKRIFGEKMFLAEKIHFFMEARELD